MTSAADIAAKCGRVTAQDVEAIAAEGWMARVKMGRRLGVSPRTVARWSARRPWLERRAGGEYRIRLATLPEEAPDIGDPPAIRHRPADGWIERTGYLYDGDRDLYILQLPSQRAPLPLPGARVRQLWRAYSGDQATIAEVCRTFAIDRQTFTEIKRARGLTKSRSPFTDEEIEARPAADLVEDVVKAKERQVMASAERRIWSAIKRKATDRTWLESVVKDALGAGWILPEVPAARRGAPDRVAAVVGLADLHIGKRPHKEAGSLERQRVELLELLARARDRLLKWRPEEVIIILAGDLVHSDNIGQTTTKGTPQGSQSVGSTVQALRLALEVVAAFIDELLKIAPVKVVSIPGNHDELLSQAIGLALVERYRHAAEVTIDASERRRKVASWRGVPLICFHGDKIKPAQYGSIVALETPADCDPRRAVLLQGHWHKAGKQQDTIAGFETVWLCSPAPEDDWHHASGYDLGTKRRLTLLRLTDRGLDALTWARL